MINDASYLGRKITWVKNKRDPGSTSERLDRFLVNSMFKHNATPPKRFANNSYKFEESWLKVEGCNEVIDDF